MLTTLAASASAFFVVVGVAGLVYGVTGTTTRRNQLGVRICQFGFVLGGLTSIGSSIFLQDTSAAASGLLLLVFGTGVTGISPRKTSDKTGAEQVLRR